MAGRPSKRSISTAARDILWMLSEAGEEDIGCIANTLRDPESEAAQPAFLRALGTALAELQGLGLIQLSLASSQGRAAVSGSDAARVLMLANNMTWHAEEGCYTWARPSWNGRALVVALSDAGQDFLEQ